MPLLFITLLCVGMVEGGYVLFEHFVLDLPGKEAGGPEVPAAQPEAKQKETAKKQGPEVILQRNLFGALTGDMPAIAPAPEKMEMLAVSSLQVVLMGTVTGSEGTERAIILDKGKRKQELYSEGDRIQGALVKEIRRGKVILAQSDREEILDISEAAKVRPRAPLPALQPPPALPVPAKSPAPPEKAMYPPEPAPEEQAGEEALDTPEEESDPNATQIRLSRVVHPARGQKPGMQTLRSNATQHQGNTNE